MTFRVLQPRGVSSEPSTLEAHSSLMYTRLQQASTRAMPHEHELPRFQYTSARRSARSRAPRLTLRRNAWQRRRCCLVRAASSASTQPLQQPVTRRAPRRAGACPRRRSQSGGCSCPREGAFPARAPAPSACMSQCIRRVEVAAWPDWLEGLVGGGSTSCWTEHKAH